MEITKLKEKRSKPRISAAGTQPPVFDLSAGEPL